MLREYLYLPIEVTVNQALKFIPNIQESLNELEGKTITVHVHDLIHYTFSIQFINQRIKIFPQQPSASDLIITGSSYYLFRLLIAKGTAQQQLLASGKIKISGDILLADTLKQLLETIEIDWEEQLAYIIGDIGAHQVGQFVGSICQWGGNTFDSLQQNVSEYLQEEIKLTPPREEVEDFFCNVDDLRMAMDRLTAHWERLNQQKKSL